METKRNYSTISPEEGEAIEQMQLNGVKHQIEVLGWSVAAATRYAEMCGSLGNPLVKEYLESKKEKPTG